MNAAVVYASFARCELAERVWQRAVAMSRHSHPASAIAKMLVEHAFRDVIGARGFQAMLVHVGHRDTELGLPTLVALYELACTLLGRDIASGLFVDAAAARLCPGVTKCRSRGDAAAVRDAISPGATAR